MLGRKKDDQFAKGGHTVLDHALEVKGDVRFSGVLDIDGVVHGNVHAVDGASAQVRVREKGCVCGDIHAPNIIVNGKVNGNVYAQKHLELAAKAEVNGNVHYKVIEMVKGSQVNGNLMHLDDPVSTEKKPEKQPEKIKVLADEKESPLKGVADSAAKSVNT